MVKPAIERETCEYEARGGEGLHGALLLFRGLFLGEHGFRFAGGLCVSWFVPLIKNKTTTERR